MKSLLPISLTNPAACRASAKNPDVVPVELFRAEPNGHKFSPGEKRVLVGLVDFPEFNGETVTITAIRDDGDNGRAYYVEGRINEVCNWVYDTDYNEPLLPLRFHHDP